MSRLLSIYTNILHRSLLSTDDTEFGTTDDSHASTGCDDSHSDSGHHSQEEAFEAIYFVMLFMACLWFIGKIFSRFGLPSLVGEILVGIILGPNLIGMVPYSDALIVIGEIGLVLLVLEAGIDVKIGHLKVVGTRGLAVAIFGSMLPLTIGSLLGYYYLSVHYYNEVDNLWQSAIAIGACLAPTSMGIALNVLRNARVLNTPTGQLIIAAAVLDDVIALMLLSELEAFADPTPAKIIIPLIISPIFIIFFGFLAIKVTPFLIHRIMTSPYAKKKYHENIILILLFLATFILIPVCSYSGSSHLLGAFLAGLMFCTDHTIHDAWNNQIKRIMQWMLRVFFACTIGFAVPIQDFWNKKVIIGSLLYLCAIIGKILTGIFSKPMTVSEFFTIGFSMSAWGEFAFILAAASYANGSLNKDSYSSVLLAVLISVIVAPLLLRLTLFLHSKYKTAELNKTRDAHHNDGSGSGTEHSVYFCIHTKGKGRWGHQDRCLHAIFDLKLEIIDFRSFNEAEYNYSHHLPLVQDVFYVQDTTLSLPPTKRLSRLKERTLQKRYKEIKHKLRAVMNDPHGTIDVMRWLPGVRKKDDIVSPSKKDQINNIKPSATYCRKEAYKQARLAIAAEHQYRSSSHLVSGISRIRPQHDALYRDKFSYHGAIHTEEDDLIAMAFLDTLTSIQASLSPLNRASPTGDGDTKPLNNEELVEKLETLRTYVQQMPAFQGAMSDDGRLSNLSNSALSSQHSIDIHNGPNGTTTKDTATVGTVALALGGGGNVIQSFNSLTIPPNGAASHSLHNLNTTYRHGSIVDLKHQHSTHSIVASDLNKKSVPIPPTMPGMFTSQSHQSIFHDKYRHHNYYHHGYHHNPYHHIIPSFTHSISAEHPLHHSSDDNHSDIDIHSIGNISKGDDDDDDSDDERCDTMYGDEDDHHRPLPISAFGLDGIQEPANENDDDDDDPQSIHNTKSLNNDVEEEKKHNNNNNKSVKKSHSTLIFSKIFKHNHHNNDKKHKKNKNKNSKFILSKKNKKKHDKKYELVINNKHGDNISDHHSHDHSQYSTHSHSSGGINLWRDNNIDNDHDTTPLDPKFLDDINKLKSSNNNNNNVEIVVANTNIQSKSHIVLPSSSVSPGIIDNNNDNNETQPLKTE